MSAWWPRSFVLQLLALMLVGLLASHLLGLLFLSRNQGALHPMARNKAIDLFARVVRATEPLDAAAAADMLARLSDAQAAFRLAADPVDTAESRPNASADEAAQEMADTLARSMGRDAQAIRVCLGEHCATPQDEATGRRPALALVLQAPRADGQWVHATLWPEVRTRWWWPVSFWLQIGLLPIFLAVAFAQRHVLRPARALSVAAGRVSRGEKVPPLRVEGPREMREILRAFNQMQERITRYMQDRTRMLAAVSHDFRTPITSLRLRTEMVTDERQRAAMVKTLDEMRRMVDETLRFARDDDDDGQEETQVVDLPALLDALVAEQQALGRDVRWASAPAPLAGYRCRPLALKRACANLVENAVRYGHQARLRLACDAVQQALHIDVDDQGPGIAPEHLEAVFRPFRRLADDKAPRADSSSGLGLAIARSNARAHGGDVVLMPRRAGGLRARLSLPFDPG